MSNSKANDREALTNKIGVEGRDVSRMKRSDRSSSETGHCFVEVWNFWVPECQVEKFSRRRSFRHQWAMLDNELGVTTVQRPL
jgi:hypothetical protein